jgi:hypothetical protein
MSKNMDRKEERPAAYLDVQKTGTEKRKIPWDIEFRYT